MIQNRSFRRGRPLKSQKNVKRKHHFQKFDAPVSHLRLWRLLRHNFQFFFSSFFLQKYGRSDPLAQNRWKSLYYRSKSMKIDKKRCTVVFLFKNRWTSLYCRSKSMEFDTLYIKNNHLAAEVPKKAEKMLSENTTFTNSEHPYRTCGLSAASFDSSVVATCWY